MDCLFVTYCNEGNFPMEHEVPLFTVLPCKYSDYLTDIRQIASNITASHRHQRLFRVHINLNNIH